MGFFLFTAVLGIGDTQAFDLGGLVGAIIGTVLLSWPTAASSAAARAGPGGGAASA